MSVIIPGLSTLKGSEIKNVGILYENIGVYDKDGNVYYMSTDELLKVLKRSTFDLEQKRTRTWITKHRKSK